MEYRLKFSHEFFIAIITVFKLSSKQSRLEELYKQLKDDIARRKVQLIDSARYHAFVRQIDGLDRWLSEKLEITKQENYGRYELSNKTAN